MKALFWDFDGTLVDSRLKNFQVTKKIIDDNTDKDLETIPFLQSFENYKKGITKFSNWRDIYQSGFALSAEETDRVGRYWTEYQLSDKTITPVFKGILDVLTVYKEYPNVIISQNSRKNIKQVLQNNNIASVFNLILGFEEVDIRKQKPDPDSFLKGIDTLSLKNDFQIFYIGDHETDVTFARNAANVLKADNYNSSIQSIGVFYGNDQSIDDWDIKPDFVAETPKDIIHIIEGAD